ncbi:hypothetical protein BESB_040590 [Besnoitia besnoiti]|uniref:Uncharacterized protein n=1 Tax=Besnoitia besnoiti TaxID=94643 RepID=A0A2A9MMF3_BESBE|nr:hypothetical protein BESB_040590 [Besnoitia besnoiti]PFH37601.1 hypothetical protein BESB_040590 [Besnoitia besnoiti]
MVALGLCGVDDLPEDVRLLEDAGKEVENSIFHLERSNKELREEDPNDKVYLEAIKQNEVALETKRARLQRIRDKISLLLSRGQSAHSCCAIFAGSPPSSGASACATSSLPSHSAGTEREHLDTFHDCSQEFLSLESRASEDRFDAPREQPQRRSPSRSGDSSPPTSSDGTTAQIRQQNCSHLAPEGDGGISRRSAGAAGGVHETWCTSRTPFPRALDHRADESGTANEGNDAACLERVSPEVVDPMFRPDSILPCSMVAVFLVRFSA